jgi:hypothetical protein
MREWKYNSAVLDLYTGWRLVVSFMPLRFVPWERTPVPIRSEGGWASEPVWTLWSRLEVKLSL